MELSRGSVHPKIQEQYTKLWSLFPSLHAPVAALVAGPMIHQLPHPYQRGYGAIAAYSIEIKGSHHSRISGDLKAHNHDIALLFTQLMATAFPGFLVCTGYVIQTTSQSWKCYSFELGGKHLFQLAVSSLGRHTIKDRNIIPVLL